MNYLLLLLTSSLYAAWLSTEEGDRFSQDHTAESVGLGVGLTLFWLLPVLKRDAWFRVLLAFLIAGIPIYTRSLIKRGELG